MEDCVHTHFQTHSLTQSADSDHKQDSDLSRRLPAEVDNRTQRDRPLSDVSDREDHRPRHRENGGDDQRQAARSEAGADLGAEHGPHGQRVVRAGSVDVPENGR